MTEKGICPGCGRQCDLSAPHCGKGLAFAQNGALPERGHGKHHHHGLHMPHSHSADINDKLIIGFRDISHIMRMQYEGKASQKRILIILKESGGLTQKELTERLGVQPGSASEILAKLENAGLISRTQNETDRRTTDILLTDAGDKLASEAAQQRKTRHEEMFSCLTEAEKATLLSLLQKICSDWESRYIKRPVNAHHDRHGEYTCHGGHSHPFE